MDTVFAPFVQAVTDTIQGWLPKLQSCEAHPGRFDLGELKAFATKAPGVRVAVLGLGDSAPLASGERDVTLLMAAYVIAKDQVGLARHISALNMVETLASRIPEHTMGSACAYGAGAVRAQNLYSGEVQKAGINLWALSWSQKVRIGVSVWEQTDTDAPIPSELYVSPEPLTGPEHIDYYTRVDTLPG